MEHSIIQSIKLMDYLKYKLEDPTIQFYDDTSRLVFLQCVCLHHHGKMMLKKYNQDRLLQLNTDDPFSWYIFSRESELGTIENAFTFKYTKSGVKLLYLGCRIGDEITYIHQFSE